tara:strand:+ start:1093 stop:1341 length:249 start_codon:yes stop_codon:yes gene_type:complete
MSSRSKGFPGLVDNAIDNPAFDMLGGYHLFLRRLLIPILIVIVAMIIYDLTDHKIVTAILTGLSVGPIVNFERFLAERKIHK